MPDVTVVTKEEFEAASAYEKGYMVYMAGCRADQPNIPRNYEPTEADSAEYARGQFAGVLEAQDSED